MLAITACQSTPGPLGRGATAAEAFAPVALRVHPLTHIEPAAKGGANAGSEVVLHLELKDRYGDAVKGLGRLTVMLYRPARRDKGSGSAADDGATERQDIKWNLADFAEADSNMRRYDSATRTYRVLLDAPAWVMRTIKEERGGYVKLRVILALAGESGEKVLTDDFIVQR